MAFSNQVHPIVLGGEPEKGAFKLILEGRDIPSLFFPSL
ncbi:hypothetical Protein YC6258_02701 [Gynuella sunshinyii YC6258]|uniref:Uncharacterized protein n=1 Tax=Gynuella sunshinyii YC6258 TaxID=1445510 RepID=A0A0C5VWG5_9GAMM|nr:hypothetical Protein YC6258_02701 [Gynuella sunshinyii YC6258]